MNVLYNVCGWMNVLYNVCGWMNVLYNVCGWMNVLYNVCGWMNVLYNVWLFLSHISFHRHSNQDSATGAMQDILYMYSEQGRT